MVENLSRKLTLILSLLLLATLSLWIAGFRLGLDLQGGTRLVYSVDLEKALAEDKITKAEFDNPDQVFNQMIEIWRERIDPQGVREPIIRREGGNQIVIELPGSASALRKSVSSELKANIDVLAKQLQLATADEEEAKKFPSTGGVIQIGSEQLRYGSRQDNVLLELERGFLGTDRADHVAGSAVRLRASDPWREKIENIGDLFFFIRARDDDLGGNTSILQEENKVKAWCDANPELPISEYNALLKADADPDRSRLRWFPNPAKAPAEAPLKDKLEALIVETDEDWRFSGNDLKSVFFDNDRLGLPAVGFRLSTDKGTDFGDFTEEHIDEQMAIVLNGEIATFPNIKNRLSGGGQIEGGAGGFTIQEVEDLITLLRSGSLKIRPQFEAQESVGATLGADYVKRGAISGIAGIVIVLLFVLFYYRRLGVLAAVSLIYNLVLLTGALAFLQATLTLPGVAGIILTVGMAVDANILIYERIREEALRGRKPLQAAKDGFGNALSTIVDANLTTLITALILYKFGTGPVRGFATTLSIGIITSMFSALVLTRVLVHLQLERGVESFSMTRWIHDTKIAFLAKAKVTALFSIGLILAGLAVFGMQKETDQLGIDFLGGTTMTLQTSTPHAVQEMRDLVANVPGLIGQTSEVKAIRETGNDTDGYTKFRVIFKGEAEQETVRREVEDAFGTVLTKGPFDEFAVAGGSATGRVYFEQEHDVADIVASLEKAGVSAATVQPLANTVSAYTFAGTVSATKTQADLEEALNTLFEDARDSKGERMLLASAVSEVNAVGAQVVSDLRDKAIFAILISLFAAVMYIRVRFAEYSFGYAAVTALVHDVLIVLGFIGLAIQSGLIEAEINLPMIAAFLTIIGYSLNDTIVVFDRIRENRPRMTGSLAEVIDTSINQTLSRTVLTSITTLIAVTILFAVNVGSGNVLEGFAYALIIGVVVGTYSSMFVACPMLHFLETRRLAKADPGEGGTPVPAPQAG